MDFLLYGCYGYTGKLILKEALAKGLKPLLAGRNEEKTKALAIENNLNWMAFSIRDSAQLEEALGETKILLNCAGPFRQTWKPAVDACLKTQSHYLDITGEIEVIEGLAHLHSQALQAGIMLLPAVGFDVVPSDCLAMKLHLEMPDAISLDIGILNLGGGLSQGTANTILEYLSDPCLIRENGKLKGIRNGSIRKNFDYGKGQKSSVIMSWGDVSSAWHSTGIPNIRVFFQLPEADVRLIKLSHFLKPILQLKIVKKGLRWAIQKWVQGPNDAELLSGKSILIGEARNAKGDTLKIRMQSPQGYFLTAKTAVAAVEKVMNGECKPGFMTPSKAFGADFSEKFGGAKRLQS